MAHSKRNTALPHFTSHERSLLKHTWGSQSTRLTRDSYLPFGSCLLCLQLAADPVACPTGGEIFCRECILRNLVAQKGEIERLKKVVVREKIEEIERQGILEEERKEGEREQFERVSAGLEGIGRTGAGVKRKFDGSEKKEAGAGAESSFWVPSKTPEAKKELKEVERLRPLCPGSLEQEGRRGKHELGLKGLVGIKFTYPSTEQGRKGEGEEQTGNAPICPACVKKLSNASKGVMGSPCGHVVCKGCAETLSGEKDENGKVKERKCYVCEESLVEEEGDVKVDDETQGGRKKRRRKEGTSKGVKRGVVELRYEGTGFAGGGENVVKKAGTAFQC